MVDHNVPSPTLSSPNDTLLEQDLEDFLHFRRHEAFRLNLRTSWSTYDPHITVLHHNTYVEFPSREPLRGIWNKPTCFYFEPSSYTSFPSRIVLAAIYEAWRHGWGEHWNPEYGHFIANPVRISDQGPKTLEEIAAIHQEICAFVKDYEPEDERYRMHRSYPQVLLVCDRFHNLDPAKDEEGNINLKKYAEQNTVLVVKTSSSQDICFDDLASHALPLERSDAGDLEVLRVPLSVAVKYMIALETRMGEQQGRNPNRFDTEMRMLDIPFGFDSIVQRHPAMWATAMTEVARAHGCDGMEPFDWPAGRITAGVSGQPYELEQDSWREQWKTGYE